MKRNNQNLYMSQWGLGGRSSQKKSPSGRMHDRRSGSGQPQKVSQALIGLPDAIQAPLVQITPRDDAVTNVSPGERKLRPL